MTGMGDNSNLTEKEIEALHQLQLGKEHIRKAYGQLLGCHHEVGRGMNKIKKATEILEDCEREDLSEEVGSIVPANATSDRWTWEIVDDFEDNLLEDVLKTDKEVREELADGQRHINEEQMENMRKSSFWDIKED